jgi:aldehyde dehydrogenase (NAD+)
MAKFTGRCFEHAQQPLNRAEVALVLDAVDPGAGELDSGTAIIGGDVDRDDLYIAPTVLVDVGWDTPIMKEEVFGPILQSSRSTPCKQSSTGSTPITTRLGLYIFAEDDDVVDQILDATESGDAVVSDCSVHPLVPELPFGGVGNSGMG